MTQCFSFYVAISCFCLWGTLAFLLETFSHKTHCDDTVNVGALYCVSAVHKYKYISRQ